MWVMGEWAVYHWIVSILSFQKIYGLYGLKHHTVDLLSCSVDPDLSCPRTDGRTKVIQEVLADLKSKFNFTKKETTTDRASVQITMWSTLQLCIIMIYYLLCDLLMFKENKCFTILRPSENRFIL